jgi:hypothetical protein
MSEPLGRSGRRLAALAVALAATGGIVAVAPPAQAAVLYRVNMTQACKDTYRDAQSMAAYTNPWSAYSWYCSHVEVPYPPVYRWQGGVDIQRYCNIHYPNSQALVGPSWLDSLPIYRWVCSRNY